MSHADKKPTRAKRVAPRSPALRSGDMVGLPEGMQLLRVSDAEFETAKRIMARWMFEHPEVEKLVLRRQDGRQPNK